MEMDMTNASKSKKELTIVDTTQLADNHRETLAAKGDMNGKGVGRSATNVGNTLPALFIIASGGIRSEMPLAPTATKLRRRRPKAEARVYRE